ncbi:hypothetical protein [Luteimicrobium sp. DT211]|uniref:hypothetical protein n=1 Tax=Luteimicrobium sp. DT211 TaxID=3393412 RepID=UPI003CFAED6A
MAALAGLVPPLLVSVALVAGLRRSARRQLPTTDVPDPPGAADVEHACRACGWPLDRPGWVDGRPTSAICDCCACEAGIDDVTPDRARAHRRRWVEHGAEWFDPGSRPESWDLYAHLCELAPV